MEILKRIKDIFDEYELETDFSLKKKKANQNLLNEMYAECLEIMQKRIEAELEGNNITNPQEYKRYQNFFLKKMNSNFRSASKTDGFRFSRTPIIHDISFCTDNLSKKDLARIAREQTAMVNFGFDNNPLGKYSKDVIIANKDKKFFNKTLKAPSAVLVKQEKIVSTQAEELDEKTEHCKMNKTYR